MAWRPTRYVTEGEIDSTLPGKVTGWLQFAPMKDKAMLDLTGDFHRDIRGAWIHLCGDGCCERIGYLYGFCPRQTGKAGNMTARYPPRDCRYGPWFEWDASAPIRAVLQAGRICDFFRLVRSALRTYSPHSPHVSPSDRQGRPCHDCGQAVTEDNRYLCESCDRQLCDACIRYCRRCDRLVCQGCLITCPHCQDLRCQRCIEACGRCHQLCCPWCLEEDLCPACGKKQGRQGP